MFATFKLNLADSTVQGLSRAYNTEVGILLACGSNFGRMSFLPSPMTRVDTRLVLVNQVRWGKPVTLTAEPRPLLLVHVHYSATHK